MQSKKAARSGGNGHSIKSQSGCDGGASGGGGCHSAPGSGKIADRGGDVVVEEKKVNVRRHRNHSIDRLKELNGQCI